MCNESRGYPFSVCLPRLAVISPRASPSLPPLCSSPSAQLVAFASQQHYETAVCHWAHFTDGQTDSEK